MGKIVWGIIEDQETPPKSEIELLKEENSALLKRVEEAENAIMLIMDMNLS